MKANIESMEMANPMPSADWDKLLSIQAEFLFTLFNQHNVPQGHITTQFIFICIIVRCMGLPLIPEWLRERLISIYASLIHSTSLFTLTKREKREGEKKAKRNESAA